MIRPALVAVALLLAYPVTAAWAVPMCDGPNFSALDGSGKPFYSEEDEAARGQQRLRARGIDANNTRFWNGCLQTFVTENGHQTMRFYDPDSLREIPVN